MDTSKHALGRHADLPDQRDFKFSLSRTTGAAHPIAYRAKNFGIYDQGNLGSCVGHGVTGAFRQLLAHENLPDYVGSRLGVYYGAREIENTVAVDAGASIRDGVKVVNNTGLMPEIMWPYIESAFATKPPPAAYAAAKKHIAIQYQSVDNKDYDACCRAIYQNGNLIIGITVYESFESDVVARNGKVPLPQPKEQVLGGHCMRAIGYTPKNLIIANSWGTGWGDFGLCYLPREYVTNPSLASDFWTLVRI